MRRRDFIAAFGGAAAFAPICAHSQQGKPATIGVLVLGSPDPEVFLGVLREGLRNLGYFEGQNIRLMLRSAQGKAGELPKLAAELVSLKIDVIVTFQTPPLLAASQTTTEIPIVMATGNPAAIGRIVNFSRPGGNVTGVVQGGLETIGKNVELIHELLPSARQIAVLANTADPFTKPYLAEIERGARSFGLIIESTMVNPDQQFDAAFAEMHRKQVDAVIVQPSLLRKDGIDLALKYRLPTFSHTRHLPAMGGLASYAARVEDVYREAAVYVDKILKGSKAGDLPIAFPTKFELVINLRTAKALGMTIPPIMLSRADEVIE